MMRDAHLHAAAILDSTRRALAGAVVSEHLTFDPQAADRHSRAGFPDLVDDTAQRLACLAEAVAADRPALFTTQIAWLKVAFVARGMSAAPLLDNLHAMRTALPDALPAEIVALALAPVHTALDGFRAMPETIATRLTEQGPHRAVAQQYLLALLELRNADARAFLARALAQGARPEDLTRDVLAFVQAEIGRMWQLNELSVAEEHLASEVVDSHLRWLYDQVTPWPRRRRRSLCAAVSGDLHGLTVRWLARAFEAAGWDPVCLGANMPDAELGHAVSEFGCDVVCLSATLPTHVRATARAVATVRAHAKRPVTVLVGGAPFVSVPDLWQVVGADATARDPIEAVVAADAFVRNLPR